MKKAVFRALSALIFLAIFTLPSFAANTDEYYKDQLEASGAKELSELLDDETKDYL